MSKEQLLGELLVSFASAVDKTLNMPLPSPRWHSATPGLEAIIWLAIERIHNIPSLIVTHISETRIRWSGRSSDSNNNLREASLWEPTAPEDWVKAKPRVLRIVFPLRSDLTIFHVCDSNARKHLSNHKLYSRIWESRSIDLRNYPAWYCTCECTESENWSGSQVTDSLGKMLGSDPEVNLASIVSSVAGG